MMLKELFKEKREKILRLCAKYDAQSGMPCGRRCHTSGII